MSCVNATEILDNDENITMLNQEIDEADDTISLTKNYTFSTNESLCINKSLELNGNNFTIDLNNLPEIIEIGNNSELIFKNIKFKNVNDNFILLTGNFNLTFIDCEFEKNISVINITLINQSYSNTTGKISPEIRKLAKSIVGESEGIKAVKKLAVWVSKNIEHEKGVGFYQSPLETLNRKKGNCCCHSELFLQLCHSLGLTKQFNMYIVHSGTMEYQERHFFTIVGNLCVDPDKNRPWGRNGFRDRTVYAITEYPYLPIIREY